MPTPSSELAERWRAKLAEDYATFGLEDLLDAVDLDGGLGGRRGRHTAAFTPMWEEMTALFRDHPGATW